MIVYNVNTFVYVCETPLWIMETNLMLHQKKRGNERNNFTLTLEWNKECCKNRLKTKARATL